MAVKLVYHVAHTSLKCLVVAAVPNLGSADNLESIFYFGDHLTSFLKLFLQGLAAGLFSPTDLAQQILNLPYFLHLVSDYRFYELRFLFLELRVVVVSRLIGKKVHPASIVPQHVVDGLKFQGMQEYRVLFEAVDHLLDFLFGEGHAECGLFVELLVKTGELVVV